MLLVELQKKKLVFKLCGINHLTYMNNIAENNYLKVDNFYLNSCCHSFDNHKKTQQQFTIMYDDFKALTGIE